MYNFIKKPKKKKKVKINGRICKKKIKNYIKNLNGGN